MDDFTGRRDAYAKGRPHVWYPYTQMRHMPEPLKVTSARGCVIVGEDGREYVDGLSSWWSACHGYSHPHIVDAMKRQADRMSHVMFAGVAHEPAYELAARLCALTGLDRVFFSDSGSTAVETAMKMATQYWRNVGKPRKNKFLCFLNGYHGDTMGCMSLCDPDKGMHRFFNGYMPKQYAVPLPTSEYDFAELDGLFADISRHTAAVALEPLVQGAGGFAFHGADVLAEIRRLCAKHEMLFIADELMTGFYRLGSAFACEEANILPDIMCVGKALTGGHVGLAATLATEKIYDAFLGDDVDCALMSGSTFMANPLACAAANASLGLFEREDRAEAVASMENFFYRELSPLRDLPAVRNVRVKGALGVVECDMTQADLTFLRQKSLELGTFLRPFGNVIYVAPPFIASEGELEKLASAVRRLAMELAERKALGKA